MIRPVDIADLPRLLELAAVAGANRFTDPTAATEAMLRPLIDAGTVFAWQDSRRAALGFAAADLARGSVAALFVASGEAGKGIGRALLEAACGAIKAAGNATAVIAIAPGTAAERHFRAAGWTVVGQNEASELVFQKPL